MSGEHVEDLGHLRGDRWLRGNQPQIRIEPRGGVIVIAGAQVSVAAQAILIAAHQHGELAMGLQAHDAIDHVDAAVFEALGPLDVGRFVAAGLQLDEHGHFLAALGRVDERLPHL